MLRGIRGVEVSDETLSYDVIGEVIDGPSHFLVHEQTLERMTRDYVYPALGDRESIEVWQEQGQPDIRDTARERVKEILASHYPRHIDTVTDAKIRDNFDIHLPRERMQSTTT